MSVPKCVVISVHAKHVFLTIQITFVPTPTHTRDARAPYITAVADDDDDDVVDGNGVTHGAFVRECQSSANETKKSNEFIIK